jgi:hypothetical protein
MSGFGAIDLSLVDNDEGHAPAADEFVAHAVAFATNRLGSGLSDSTEIVPYAVPNPKPDGITARVFHDDADVTAQFLRTWPYGAYEA